MENYKITYKQAKDLGFKRTEMIDNVFYNQNGFQDFVMELKIGEFVFDWNNISHEVELRRILKGYKIAGKLKINSKDQFIDLLNLFGFNCDSLVENIC